MTGADIITAILLAGVLIAVVVYLLYWLYLSLIVPYLVLNLILKQKTNISKIKITGPQFGQ